MRGKQAKRLRRLVKHKLLTWALEDGTDLSTMDAQMGLAMRAHAMYKTAKRRWRALSNPKSLEYVDDLKVPRLNSPEPDAQ